MEIKLKKQNDTVYCIVERQCGVGTKDELRERMTVEEKLLSVDVRFHISGKLRINSDSVVVPRVIDVCTRRSIQVTT